jgi:hypothetical protein
LRTTDFSSRSYAGIGVFAGGMDFRFVPQSAATLTSGAPPSSSKRSIARRVSPSRAMLIHFKARLAKMSVLQRSERSWRVSRIHEQFRGFFLIYCHREIVEVYQGKGNNGRWRSSRCINASSIERRFARLLNESCDASRLNSCSRILSVAWRTTSRRSSRDLRMTKATIQSARRAVRNIASASDILPCGSDNSATKLKSSHSNARSIVTIMAIASRNPSWKLDHGCLAIVPGP